MKKQNINGIEYTNFGSNNYSRGMEAVVFNPKDITPEDVHNLEGFYLHPTCEPNSLEIFALKGTLQNYVDFTDEVRRNESSLKASQRLNSFDFDVYDTPEYQEFKPWHNFQTNS